MKLAVPILALMTALGAVLVSPSAEACGTGAQRVDDATFAQPPDQVSQLLQEASRLDARARQLDQTASSLDRTADTLATRARELRNLAFAQGDLDRDRLLAQSNQLSAQAAISRANAQERRAQASQLRVSARETRDRAVRLAGGTTTRPRPWRSVQTTVGQTI